MARYALVGIFWLVSLNVLIAQAVVPPAVTKSAVAAVEELGKKVVNSDYRAAIDSMYPQWKERMAKRKGGIKQLEQELDGIGDTLARQGIQIISFKVVGVPKSYEVWPGKGGDAVGGKPNFTKWLILIPTVTQFRIFQGDGPKAAVIDSHGFQVAIADKGKNNWSFINGSDVSVSDLRSLFITLPANMELPPVKHEAAN